jgi:hypothetical protein
MNQSIKAVVLAVVATLLLLTVAGFSGAIAGPIPGAVPQLGSGVVNVEKAVPVAEDDLPGHDTEDPESPDHASGSVVDADLGGNDVADASATNSQIEDSGRASGDATVLALGGNEVIGAHSSSDGTTSEEFDILGPLCDGTEGAICVQLLWASTTSSQDASSSSSESHTALAFACVGGTATNADQHCDGAVGASVGESHSSIERDNTTGAESASQSTDVADVCLGGEDTTGLCSGLGFNALHSEASADTSGASARGSQLLGIEAMGENNPVLADPTGVSVLPDCPSGSAVVCLFLNQGEDLVGDGSVGASQEALHLGVVDELVLGHASEAEVLVSQGGQAPPFGRAPAAAAPGGLPVTGGELWLPFAAALNLMVAGSLAVAWDRRNRLVPVA